MPDPHVINYVHSVLLLIKALSDTMLDYVYALTVHKQRRDSLIQLTAIVDDFLVLPIPPPCMRLHRDCVHLFQMNSALLQAIQGNEQEYFHTRAEHQEAIVAIHYEIAHLTALYGVEI